MLHNTIKPIPYPQIAMYQQFSCIKSVPKNPNKQSKPQTKEVIFNRLYILFFIPNATHQNANPQKNPQAT
jgi:hypothetical protein